LNKIVYKFHAILLIAFLFELFFTLFFHEHAIRVLASGQDYRILVCQFVLFIFAYQLLNTKRSILSNRFLLVFASLLHLLFPFVVPLIFKVEYVKGIYRIFGFDPSVRVFDDAQSLGDFSRCLSEEIQQKCYEQLNTFPYSPYSRYLGLIYQEIGSLLPVILEIVILFLLYRLVSKLDLPNSIFYLSLFNGPLLFLYERGNIDQFSLICGLGLALKIGSNFKILFFSLFSITKATNVGFFLLKRNPLWFIFGLFLVFFSYNFNFGLMTRLFNRRAPEMYGSFGSKFLTFYMLLTLIFGFLTFILLKKKNILSIFLIPSGFDTLLTMFAGWFILTAFSGPNVLYHFVVFLPYLMILISIGLKNNLLFFSNSIAWIFIFFPSSSLRFVGIVYLLGISLYLIFKSFSRFSQRH